jgi:hypothetical protein
MYQGRQAVQLFYDENTGGLSAKNATLAAIQ